MNNKPLILAADLWGCPNRCLHCWLGHMPNRAMEPGADAWIVDRFRPYFDSITFYSWLREPDFCPDYRQRWERDKALCVNAVPERFELASFWRLVRDPDYVVFLKELGVPRIQLSFFGLETTTDRYVGRKGAFRELLEATELLLRHGISPRWQAFLNEENREELAGFPTLIRELGLETRCAAFGGEFRFFVHPGSCDGENRRLYPIRIRKDRIPETLIPYYLNYEQTRTEAELCAALAESPRHPVYRSGKEITLFVSNQYELFFNFTHMRPEWRIGNLKTDPTEELVRRVLREDTPALRTARRVTLAHLVRRFGDPASQRAFEEEDYISWLFNRWLEEA